MSRIPCVTPKRLKFIPRFIRIADARRNQVGTLSHASHPERAIHEERSLRSQNRSSVALEVKLHAQMYAPSSSTTWPRLCLER